MGNHIQLLTPAEIAAMAEDEDIFGRAAAAYALEMRVAAYQERWCPARIVATLMELRADRDHWKMLAETAATPTMYVGASFHDHRIPPRGTSDEVDD